MTILATEQGFHAAVRYFVDEEATRPWGCWEILATGRRYTRSDSGRVA